eukprot:CAMPEP_0113299070 /NCGR_PEP_ID=MMETSP0010_2-20120614/1252_1 /TAXON_ID=216773 ORGANISM="Corethron hystrix, Strain 308" /NCGR_SAMPLE_ID=MMETSP0010_2 /ASSEMBLY_ACC=CAM_ASM_000155 /LENGTH=137 /DNA_ID=CAMNT_0000152231 /DNA_START=126 /DNA_END=535 /DNA_ORIENTATION=+ /assembly_acc=CAM_ASM_000155
MPSLPVAFFSLLADNLVQVDAGGSDDLRGIIFRHAQDGGTGPHLLGIFQKFVQFARFVALLEENASGVCVDALGGSIPRRMRLEEYARPPDLIHEKHPKPLDIVQHAELGTFSRLPFVTGHPSFLTVVVFPLAPPSP